MNTSVSGGKPGSQTSELRPGVQTEFQVHGLSPDGRGVARLGGMVAFIVGALPGQTVRARVTAVKKRFAEAEAETVLSPSPDQVEPACPHFAVCGGCPLMGLAYPAQLAWKRRFVADALKRLGGLEGVEVAQCLPSPQIAGHRNKMEFAFQNGPNGEILLGLRRSGGREVFDLVQCPVCAPESVEILSAVRDAVRSHARKSGVSAFNPKTRKGVWRHLNIRTSQATGRAAVQLVTAPGRLAEALAGETGSMIMERFPLVASFTHSVRRGASMSASGQETRLVLGDRELEERLDRVRYRISADAFFQTNTAGAEVLYRTVARALEAGGSGRPPELLADLYSGAGGLALFLASGAKRIKGYEIHAGAVRDARANAELNGARNVEFVAGNVAGTFAADAASRPPDAVVCDPPRAGMEESVAEAILAAGPAIVVAVSCNPATLARDAARLASGYRVERVVPVDMFPHTGHVECVAGFARIS